MGRQKKYNSPAEKQAAYRARMQPEQKDHVRQETAKRQGAYRARMLPEQKDRLRETRQDKQHRLWLEKRFVSFDGEGKDDEKGQHRYTMLTCADHTKHHSIQNEKGLSTVQCLDFLVEMKQHYKNHWFVAFSFNYDINMMLKDLREASLRKLAKNGVTLHTTKDYAYYIKWIPGKIFQVTRYKGQAKETVIMYDTFGFFQMSFVRALEEWQVGTHEQRQTILAMKQQRGNFANVDTADVLRYNIEECKLLCEMLDKMKEALDTCDLRINSWHGAGAISGALLKKHRIQDTIVEPEGEMKDAVMRAYFGGRFQTVQMGEFKDVHSHDINSAYPHALTHVPDLSKGYWRETDTYEPDAVLALYRVKWTLPSDTLISPFPHRHKRRISYPFAGEGWYYSPEVDAAIAIYGDKITVLEGYVFIRADKNAFPFSFLNTTFQQRKAFKKAKNQAQLVLKLGINGTYGKTAQGTIGNRKPPYQSYIYAGYCTSFCRAMIFSLAMRKPESVIAFATDGVFSAEPLTREDENGGELGQWDYGQAPYFFLLQTGVYCIAYHRGSNDIRIKRKTRGFGRKELRFAAMRRMWRTLGTAGSVRVTLRRFFGLQFSLHQNKLHNWKNWSTITKDLSFAPNAWIYRTGSYEDKPNGMRSLRLYTNSNSGLSEPYVEKGGDTDSDDADLAELRMILDQPLYDGD